MDRIRNFYKYYTKDFSYKDLEKLFKQDAPEVYDFYVNRMKQSDKDTSVTGRIKFIRNLFIEFLMQMSPARRIVYSIALIIFMLGYFNGNWQWAVFSFLLVNLLIAFELADKITAKDELSVARDIQSSLMPKESPLNKNYEICGYSDSAREVGGDYFDFIIDESIPDKMYLVIGDISGKGMAAAIHMVQVRAILHNLVLTHDSPKSILVALNSNLNKMLRAGSFFTVSMAHLNSGKTLKLCRAGHLPLILYSRKENMCKNIIPYGMGIGLGNNILFEKTLEEISIEPETGDILVFYTDGVVEAMNGYLQEFGEERLNRVIRQNAHKPAGLIKDAILDAVESFAQSTPRHDDLTMIVMKAI
ncbi:MAG: PP2C family protein-serine/threonine phosphatase [Ignavibacteriaceae bacterium]